MIVLWRVTEVCNLSCPFCGYDRRLARPRRAANADSIRAFGEVLAEYQRSSDKSILVSWIGGEPLLWPPLKELTVYFTQQLGLRVSTTTNGTTLNSPVVRKHLLQHYSELTVSVDGVGKVHDDLRGWMGGYASLRDSVVELATAKRGVAHSPLLRANVLLMRQTITDVERLCLELAEWGIEEITFNQLGGRDRPEFFPEHRLLPEQALWLCNEIPRLRARLAQQGVRLNGSDAYLRRIQASTRDEKIPILDCHPGEKFVFINEEGLVSPCSFTSKTYGIPVTELNRPELLHQLPLRFARFQREHRLAVCEDCQSTQVFEKFSA